MFEDLLLDDDDDDFTVVVDCFTTLVDVDDDVELVAEWEELELVE